MHGRKFCAHVLLVIKDLADYHGDQFVVHRGIRVVWKGREGRMYERKQCGGARKRGPGMWRDIIT